jgi:uncharacterized protein (DUF427 family)
MTAPSGRGEASGLAGRPDCRVDVHRKRNLVQVTYEGVLLVESQAALCVDEQDHGLVFYIPRADVRTEHLSSSDVTSRCPFKGWAKYWRLRDESQPIAWEYPEVAILGDHVAFYQDRAFVRIGTADPAVTPGAFSER